MGEIFAAATVSDGERPLFWLAPASCVRPPAVSDRRPDPILRFWSSIKLRMRERSRSNPRKLTHIEIYLV